MRPGTPPQIRAHRAGGHAVEDAPAATQARLAAALAEAGTTLVLVFGAGPEAEAAVARGRALACDPGFEAVRVLHVADPRHLTAEQRERWRCGADPGVAVLGPGRRRAVPLARPDAVELFVAVSVVAAC